MKKVFAAAALLLASTVAGSAADLAVKARPYVEPLPIWTWTGFYIGGHVGAGWGTTETTLTGASVAGLGAAAFSFPFAQSSSSGFLGGGQVGYNWQSGWAVFGVQGDIAGMDVKGTAPCIILLSCTSKSDWLASVTGRLGAVVADRGLVYVKGGAAWLNTTHSVNTPNFGLGTGIPDQIASQESTAFGWTIGMGTEWMITNNWTAFIEYNYYQFDRQNEAFAVNFGPNFPIALTVNADLVNKLSVAKVGVNYKFGGPIVAKY